MHKIHQWRLLTLTILLGFILAYAGMAQSSTTVIDQGTFVVQQGKTQLGQGNFTLVQLGSSDIELIDAMRFAIPKGPTETFSATLQMDNQLNPTGYILNDVGPQGQRTIIIRIKGKNANMITVVGSKPPVSTGFGSSTGFILFDNNLFGQSSVLYRRALAALKAGSASFQSTALIPQVGQELPVRVERGAPLKISAHGKVLQVDRLVVTLEMQGKAQQLELLGQGERFIGLLSPGQSTPAVFRSDLFPKGFTVVPPSS